MKKHLTLFLLLFMSLLTACSDYSAEEPVAPPININAPTSSIGSSFVTENDARRIAQGLISTATEARRARAQMQISNVVALLNDAGDTLMYVVNYSDEQGYVIISATRNYHPILATVESGSFSSISEIPEGESLLLSNYAENISDNLATPRDSDSMGKFRDEWIATEFPSTSSNDSTSYNLGSFMNQCKVAWMNAGYDVSDLNQNKFGLPTEYREMILRDANAYKQRDDYMETSFVIRRPGYAPTVAVGPLLTSEWGQEFPYNLLIAEKYGKEYLTGCMATAMAQIMRYHKKPTTYDWDNMPDVANVYNCSAVAKLMFDLAESVHTIYGTEAEGGTKSKYNKAKSTFKKLGYNNVNLIDHSYTEVVNQIITYKHPVIMGGTDPDSCYSHVWVCDGVTKYEYDNQIYLMMLSKNSPYCYTKYTEPTPSHQTDAYYTYHMNWGWNGKHNGWFIDGNIKTDEGNFSSERLEIINIY